VGKDEPADQEVDPRFPSGKWAGYYLMPHTGAKRHGTELILGFAGGQMSGEGRDKVGKFIIKGRYEVTTGKCEWIKRYVGAHDVHYQGYNEGKGIWGIWEIPSDHNPNWRGGFHIWPEGVTAGSDDSLHEALDLPSEIEDPALVPV